MRRVVKFRCMDWEWYKNRSNTVTVFPPPHTQPTIQFPNHATMHFSLLLASLALTSASPLIPRACTGPNVNAATVSLIKEFEGFVPSPAPDPIGLPTVGYGHLCKTEGCSEVPYSFPLTTSTASQLLAADLKVSSRPISLFSSTPSHNTAPPTNHHPENHIQCDPQRESIRRTRVLDLQRRAGKCGNLVSIAALKCG